ncbi:DUF1361 domain-containing protein (plasmid) [Bacillus sp. JAS24-2]|uniref:DUF1361 domain-containing protein n=1 Tax=Bacillus sp. JAS24-2 TaxID=2217832 RepID=UPI0011EEC007|nr:DUF1361 domain-containing protein [Bacillus sp. JAS24-2]QEL82843.1 DUF1361 domain-containing protein [Bacillus sp. JAS24-2]
MNERSKARLSFFIYISLLIICDVKYSSFLILNMFLAFSALELSFLLPLFKIQEKRDIPSSLAFYGIFILLSPNVFYVVTDLIHLNIFKFDYKKELLLKEWWNFSILTAGVLLSIFYYTLMLKQIESLLGNFKYKQGALLMLILLSSFGIYIGRFLRFHSVHLFIEPFSLLIQVWKTLNIEALLFIGWISILQLIIYWLFVSIRKDEQ